MIVHVCVVVVAVVPVLLVFVLVPVPVLVVVGVGVWVKGYKKIIWFLSLSFSLPGWLAPTKEWCAPHSLVWPPKPIVRLVDFLCP